MTFMHMDATSAAAAVGNIVGWPWDADAPYTPIYVDAGGNGFQGSAEFRLGGEGHVTYEGLYEGLEDGYVQFNENWIDPTKIAQIPNYCFRSINVVDYGSSKGSEPGTPYYNGGVWTGGRTNWRSFAITSPYTNMTSDVFAEWQCSAQGEFGEPTLEEDWDGIIEIGKLGSYSVEFEPLQVDLGLDEFVITDHGFVTGDQVVLTVGAGSLPTPLTTDTMYSISRVSSSRFSVGTGLFAVDSSPSFVNLTVSGTGSGHTFTRIDAVASVTLGMSASI